MSIDLHAVLAVWSLRLGIIVPNFLAVAQIRRSQSTEPANESCVASEMSLPRPHSCTNARLSALDGSWAAPRPSSAGS